MNIVGIIGKAGSGKDTVADMLSELRYDKIAFADPLKRFCIPANDLSHSPACRLKRFNILQTVVHCATVSRKITGRNRSIEKENSKQFGRGKWADIEKAFDHWAEKLGMFLDKNSAK